MGRQRDFPSTIDRSLRVLNANLDKLEVAMDSGNGKFNDKHSAQAQRLAKAIAALGATARRYDADARNAAGKLTHAEKRAMLRDFVRSLPREEQVELLQELMQLVNEKAVA